MSVWLLGVGVTETKGAALRNTCTGSWYEASSMANITNRLSNESNKNADSLHPPCPLFSYMRTHNCASECVSFPSQVTNPAYCQPKCLCRNMRRDLHLDSTFFNTNVLDD